MIVACCGGSALASSMLITGPKRALRLDVNHLLRPLIRPYREETTLIVAPAARLPRKLMTNGLDTRSVMGVGKAQSILA